MTSPGGVALAGAVALDVEPDARDFYPRLRAQVLPAADQVGRDLGRQMSAPVVSQLSGATADGVRRGARPAQAAAARAGEDIGAAMGRTMRSRVQAALANIPEAQIDGDSTPLERKVANVRRQLVELGDKTIGVDIDEEEALTRLQLLRNQLSAVARDIEKIKEAGGEIPLEVDAIAAGVEITRLKREIQDLQREAARPATVQVRVSAFERELRQRVQQAIAALPEVVLNADSSDVERDIARIGAELAALSTKRIGIDIDAAVAVAEIRRLQAELDRLGSESPDIDVQMNTAAASAQLTGFLARARAASANDIEVDVDVDTTGASAQLAAFYAASIAGAGGMQILMSVGALLGPVLVPAIAAVVAGLAAVGPAAIAGVAGIGVMLLAFSGIVGAVQAINAAQGQAGRSAGQMAAQQARVASATDAVAGAQRGLANTIANARDGERRSAEQVRQAVQNLSRAEADALRVRQDLTRAQEEARRAQEDLAMAVDDGYRAQRGAVLDLAEAREQLDEVMTNPRSTNLERQRAQLAYDEAVANIERLRVRQERLTAEQQESNRAGIDGSRQVVAARQQIADADERIADAQRAVTEARLAQATQERQSAFQIAQAQQSVINAQRSLAQATQQSGDTGAAAMDKMRDAMAKLSPEGRKFALFIVGLKGQFDGLRRAAEAGLLPGVQAGIEAFLPVLPQVELFISRVATAMGDLFLRAGEALASPFWVNFFDMVGQFAGPALETFGDIIGDLARGFGSLILAFMPMSQQMGDGFADMAAGFAEWAAGLATSDGFQKFIDYAVENGPKLFDLLGDIVVTAVNLGIAFAPLGAVILDALVGLFDWLAGLDPAVLVAIVAGVLGIAAAFVFVAGGPISLIVAAVVTVVAAVLYAWNRFEGFRTVVLAIWDAIATGAVWLWQQVLAPTFNFLVAAFQVVAAAAVWLWQSVLSPAFTAIGAVIMFVWENVIQPAFNALVFWVQNFLAPVIMFLWRNVVMPAWQGIQLAISIAWAVIQVIFGVIQIQIKILGAIFGWLWRNAIKPAWDAISAGISWVWENVIRPAFRAFGAFIEEWVAPAFKRGVDAVSRAWEAVREVAKAPIRFVVNTVLNDGLLAAYNRIAEMFGVNPHNVRIPLPAGFADGGYISGPGGPRSDSIFARLSNGEYVIPAHIVARMGVPFFDWLIGKRSGGGPEAGRPGDGSEGLAFADGGFVGFLASKWNSITDPIGYVREKVGDLVERIPGGRAIRDVVAGVADKTIGGVLAYIKGKITNAFTGKYRGPVSAEVVDVQRWVQGQAGKPYIWAGVGPEGYDCSGAVGAVYNMLRGKPPHSRVFTTHNQAGFFPKPGYGVFTSGWANAGERGGGSVGHTAGNLAGLPFESRGGDGMVVGNRATGVGTFAHVGTYDSGGYLLPGLTVAYNGTGTPERILTGPQWEQMQTRLSAAGQPAAGRSSTYNIYPRTAVLDAPQLQAITAAEEMRSRIGRQD